VGIILSRVIKYAIFFLLYTLFNTCFYFLYKSVEHTCFNGTAGPFFSESANPYVLLLIGL